MIRVSIANPYEYPLDFQSLKAAAKAVLEGEGGRESKVTLAFVDNAHIHRLNKQFLNHDEPTDVLTFPYTEPGSRKLEGEVVIGHEVAREYAADRGHDIGLELLLYVVHGCLHLCGHDDKTPRAVKGMRAKEREYLQKLGLPDVTDKQDGVSDMIEQIHPTELKRKLDAGEPVYLVDVRNPDEYAYCRLPDSLLLPLPELATRTEEVQPPAGAVVVVYCHHGVRSLSGAAILQRAGFENAASLMGGIDLWSRVVDPAVPRY